MISRLSKNNTILLAHKQRPPAMFFFQIEIDSFRHKRQLRLTPQRKCVEGKIVFE